MGRPINKRFLGEFSGPGVQLAATVNVNTGSGVEQGIILRQRSNNRYLVEGVLSEQQAVCRLINSISPEPGEMSVAVLAASTEGGSAVEFARNINNRTVKTFAGNVYAWPDDPRIVARRTADVQSESVDTNIKMRGPTAVETGAQNVYTVTLKSFEDIGENAEVQFVITKPGIEVADVVLEFCADSASAGAPGDCQWIPLSLNLDNGSLSGRFGPGAGFPIPAGYDASTFIRAQFNEDSVYEVEVRVVGVPSGNILSSSTLSIGAVSA